MTLNDVLIKIKDSKRLSKKQILELSIMVTSLYWEAYGFGRLTGAAEEASRQKYPTIPYPLEPFKFPITESIS